MKLRNISFLLIMILAILTSCQKNLDNPASGPQTMNELKVPENFNWETTKDIDVSISLSGTKDYQAKSKISVYTANPATGGKLMVSGNAAPGSSFASTLRIPSHLTEFFILMESPFTGSQTASVPLLGNVLTYTFGNQKSGDDFKSVNADPLCGLPGETVITQTSGTITITGGL